MPTAIEDGVKIDRIQLPAGSDCGDIFVQASNERNMTGPRFSGNAGMRNAEGALMEDF